jgi:hypothetical protein
VTTLEEYRLCYSEGEAKRLADPSVMLEDTTKYVLRCAALSPAMQVLDERSRLHQVFAREISTTDDAAPAGIAQRTVSYRKKKLAPNCSV